MVTRIVNALPEERNVGFSPELLSLCVLCALCVRFAVDLDKGSKATPRKFLGGKFHPLREVTRTSPGILRALILFIPLLARVVVKGRIASLFEA